LKGITMTTQRFAPTARSLACAFALVGTMACAQAQTVSVLAPLTTANIGDSFTLSVQASGFPEYIYGGGYNLAFDPSVLRLDAINIPAAWEFTRSTGSLSAAAGTVSDIYFNTFAAPVKGDFLTATLNFTAVGGGSSQVSLSAAADFPFGDANANAVNVAFNAATVNVAAVPEPGSFSLVISGLAAVAGLMRRRRQQHQG
jgi:hypothetical protein